MKYELVLIYNPMLNIVQVTQLFRAKDLKGYIIMNGKIPKKVIKIACSDKYKTAVYKGLISYDGETLALDINGTWTKLTDL